ncbi:hypothetical protein N0V90_001486 [Kalmusia sp. IMI 367209]|nr:hypothetical protein N0V90_001486 [Kalmusia sp. IMI 367209]
MTKLKLQTMHKSELQRQEAITAETELSFKAASEQREQSSLNHHELYRTWRYDTYSMDEAWQDYDANLWDSAPIDTAPASGSTLQLRSTSSGDARRSTEVSWTGWLGSFSPFAVATRTSPNPSADRQFSTDQSFPNQIEESSVNRDSHPLSEHRSQTVSKECMVCVEERPLALFPSRGPTNRCEHDASICLGCLETHIKTRMDSNAFNEEMIKCPECSESLTIDEIQRYADPSTAELFETRATENAIDQISELFRCPAKDCGSAQIHDSGENSPIVRCIKCNGSFCFQHRVVWHDTLSCAEYDRFLSNPRGFRSAFEVHNERMENERTVKERRRRNQEDHDAKYAQNLMASGQREEAKRKAEAEKKEWREREDREKKKRQEERVRQLEQRRMMVEEADRKKKQEAANLKTIAATTKTAHMTYVDANTPAICQIKEKRVVWLGIEELLCNNIPTNASLRNFFCQWRVDAARKQTYFDTSIAAQKGPNVDKSYTLTETGRYQSYCRSDDTSTKTDDIELSCIGRTLWQAM